MTKAIDQRDNRAADSRRDAFDVYKSIHRACVRASTIKDPIICYHQGSVVSLNTMFHGSATLLAECKRINESIPGVRVSIRRTRTLWNNPENCSDGDVKINRQASTIEGYVSKQWNLAEIQRDSRFDYKVIRLMLASSRRRDTLHEFAPVSLRKLLAVSIVRPVRDPWLNEITVNLTLCKSTVTIWSALHMNTKGTEYLRRCIRPLRWC